MLVPVVVVLALGATAPIPPSPAPVRPVEQSPGPDAPSRPEPVRPSRSRAAPLSPGSSTTTETIDDPHPFVFLDGGAPRVVIRGAVPGTDEAPAPARYVDPVSGREAAVGVGRGAIVRVATRDPAEAAAVLRAHGLVVVRSLFAHAGLWMVHSPDAAEDGAALAARLAAAGVVGTTLREAFPDLWLGHRVASPESPSIPPDDPRYAGQWFLDVLGIEVAWALSVGAPEVVVTVIDNGCDASHPDLAGKLDPGHDVVDDDDDPTYGSGPGNEHGTACAGLIAAATDNGIDIAGACPLCRASCTRLLGGAGDRVPLQADVRAFALAFEDDVDVVSNSWGFVDAIPVPQVLAEAIVDVQQNGRGGRGAVVAFASGNDNREVGEDELLAVPGVLGVGAVNNLGELTQFSNRGRSVDVVAPTGTTTTDIVGTGGGSPGDVTATFGGTSSACPLVAGVAGLVLATAPELTADEVNALIENTARQSIFATPAADGHDLAYGFGLVQPEAALRSLLPDPGVPIPPPPPSTPAAAGCGATAATTTAAPLLALVLFLARRWRTTMGPGQGAGQRPGQRPGQRAAQISQPRRATRRP